MCGIFGCIVGDGRAAPILVRGLKMLEYRGYDSAGIATIDGGKILVKKDVGKIDEIEERLLMSELPGKIGIAHTRWATHGAPNAVNAHPHLDMHSRIAVVHNGIIENYLELKRELMELRYNFVSKTDTEVVAHLISHSFSKHGDLLAATVEALRRVRGSYSLAIISTASPDRIILARRESPLIVGLGDGAVFAASDVSAFLERTNRVVYLEDGEVGVLTLNGLTIYKLDNMEGVSRKPVTLNWSIEAAHKAGFPHFTLKEIYDQPLTVREALRIQEQYADLIVEFLDRGREVFLLGAGTSYHACLAASYMFSKLARLVTYPVVASEFVENFGNAVGIDTVILAVSQSGETIDTLNALEYARLRAATVLGLTNVVGSTLTRISRAYILQNTGPEIGVAATKTFTAQLTVLAQLALRLARKRGKVSQSEIDRFKDDLHNLPQLVSETIKSVEPEVKSLSDVLSQAKVLVFLGRGLGYVTSLEARLKVMELSYIPSIALPAGESKHGPISIVEEDRNVVFTIPRDETRKLAINNVMEMKARGAKVTIVGEDGDSEVAELADHFVGVPKVNYLLSPIVYVIPYQLLAYYLALRRGLDPDKPRNLAKSVTVL
ncbi:MAG: glutamine--fructose-6-phosphate transaminase (isomerizing) [Aigarchaeota archaeon]|nr:glutamine--fructose-6-phosphate transaminase (isomerizing) [Aigarchaeota archaeon]